MRYLVSIVIVCLLSVCLLYSCSKWVDPAPKTDPRLTNPYCNDPNAVNYNWGFPGKPDNSICFYPNQLFAGTWVFYDTVYSASGSSDGLILFSDSVVLNIHSISDTLISVFGMCGSSGDSILLKAGATYIASVDTVIGDSLTTAQGQRLCRVQDTISGTMTRDRIDSPYVIHVNFTVVSDTGITVHSGSAIIKP